MQTTALLRTMSACRLTNEKSTTLSAKRLKLRTKVKNEKAARTQLACDKSSPFLFYALREKELEKI